MENKKFKKLISAYISFIIFLLFPSSPCADDLDALLKLKKAMNITGWEPSAQHYCSFSGVSCDQRSRVVALNVSNMPPVMHRGSIPAEIGLLNKLVNLNLADNNLSGRLPTEMANLTALTHLNISNNFFSGMFPGEITLGMTELEVLDAYNNNFTGQLPLELAAGCTKLKHLHLGGNYFTGNIPESYSNIRSLEYLGLNSNFLTGKLPASLARLKNLKELYLGYDNSYEGGIPPEFGSLPLLKVLDMASCNLTGKIPTSLSLLKNLHSLFLFVNRLSGFIPPELSSMASLVSLDLCKNELTGEIPESFSELKSIRLINLYRNDLYGPIPKFIGDLPHLEILQLWENNFTYELPESLGQNGRLTDLDVTGNRLTGLIPRNLCLGGRLRTLILMDNNFFGPIPLELGQCKSLVKIRMKKNRISGTIPVGIFNLPSLGMIEMNDNCLSGQLPTQMTAGTLTILSLSGNQISGRIPPAIGNLNNLKTLSLEMNRFSGKIPDEIFNLIVLSKINISVNKLGGEIPASVSNCSSLGSLDLSRNNLVGEIPRGVEKLKLVYLLNMSRNRLTGQIPDGIPGMETLTTLDLSYNNFTGRIPTSDHFLDIASFCGNPYLCTNVSRPCSFINKKSQDHNVFGSSRLGLMIIAGLPAVLGSLLILLLVFLLIKVCTGRNIQKSSGWRLTLFQQLDLKVEDLLQCIKQENIIGKGGAGIVYRGTMPSGLDIAIKQLVGSSSNRGQRDHGFAAEIKTLGQIKHRNIVRLLGHMSNNKDSNLLLYEYMPNGSLGKILHGENGGELQWERRYKIAVEAAKGLCYLHHDCSPLIIHRDIKSHNILLDSNFEAHVADFGLAKYFHGVAADCMSSFAGSFGYIAPEYGYTLKVDEKIDVYSFGVVLLELITGRKAVMNYEDAISLVGWVRKTTKSLSSSSSVLAVVDPNLAVYPLAAAVHLFKLAMLCVDNDSTARPTMREVVCLISNPPT
ncbi:hypothetical protein TB2_034708 [Malus domestica]